MRPLMVAEPMLRMPRPEITPWSKLPACDAGACALAVADSDTPRARASNVMERCMAVSSSVLGSGEGEHRRVDRLVQFGGFNVVLALFEREVHAVDFFVFAHVGGLHLLLAAHDAVVHHAD